MSCGKMRSYIVLFKKTRTQDAEGFTREKDEIIANVRAYKEERHANEKWAKLAVFTSATTLFRFRKIPDVTVDTSMYILDGDTQYDIISAEDVRGRKMFVEVLAKTVTPSEG